MGALVTALVVISASPVGNQIIHIKRHHKPQEHATMEQKKENKVLAKRYAWAGWGWRGQEWKCAYKIFDTESRFDNFAKNQSGSTAFGIAQHLNEHSTDPTIQLLHAYKYIAKRYRTPCKAWSFHQRHYYF